MFAHNEISHKVRGPTRSENARHFFFSVGLPRKMCACFVCVLSVLYTVSVLISHRESYSSSAITPCHVLIPQNVGHASESKVICQKLWMGVNRSVVIESLNQVRKPWHNKEAYYSFFRFSTEVSSQLDRTSLVNNGFTTLAYRFRFKRINKDSVISRAGIYRKPCGNVCSTINPRDLRQ